MTRVLTTILIALTIVPPATVNSLPPSSSPPSAVVAVSLDVPEFTVRELKYRVFYNKGEVKRIPLEGYDFKAALSDELLNALAEDRRQSLRMAAIGEAIDVTGLWNKKVRPPAIEADRILIVRVWEYGAFLASLGPDKFYIYVGFRLIDGRTGKKIWEKKMYERIDLDGKIADLQADSQRGLKEGINKVLEKVCAKVATEYRKAKL